MIDVSAAGSSLFILATQSFPFGFKVTEFADDQDPLTVDPSEPVGYEVLIDGSLFFYSKAAPVKVSVGVIPGSADDINLKLILQSSKGDSSLIPLPDITTMTISYPNGGTTVLTMGSIMTGPIADSIAASGRLKGNVYTFAFAQVQRLNTTKDIIGGVIGGASAALDALGVTLGNVGSLF